jgi:CheY-like chemotaxis protein
MLKLLVVEDNVADVIVVRECLREWPDPIDIIHAENGEDAVAAILANPGIHLILLDLHLPRADGISLLPGIVQTGIPVVVFSSSDRPSDRTQSLDLGAVEYVHKPLSFLEFRETIRRLVGQWGNLDLAAE